MRKLYFVYFVFAILIETMGVSMLISSTSEELTITSILLILAGVVIFYELSKKD